MCITKIRIPLPKGWKWDFTPITVSGYHPAVPLEIMNEKERKKKHSKILLTAFLLTVPGKNHDNRVDSRPRGLAILEYVPKYKRSQTISAYQFTLNRLIKLTTMNFGFIFLNIWYVLIYIE